MKKQLRFTYRPVDQKNYAAVHEWLLLPHINEWFYGQGLENTFKGLDAFLKGSSHAAYWIVFDQGHPFAFFITSEIQKPDDILSRYCTAEGSAITLDMLIGDLNYLGQGYGSLLIQEFLTDKFSHVSEVLIDPESSNKRAIHVYQKAGFVILEQFIPNHSPHLHTMMRLNLKELKSLLSTHLKT